MSLENVALERFTIGIGQSTNVLSGPGATIVLKLRVGDGPFQRTHMEPGLVMSAAAPWG
jgi:hypothetical protein